VPPDNPRFPNGLKELFRIVRIDCAVPDEGVPTMTLTLNIPAFSTPVEPPETEVKEPETAEQETQKHAAIKRAKEETAASTKEAEEEAATKKATEEQEAQERAEAEALLALQNSEVAAGLQSGLTLPQVVKMKPKEIAHHNAHHKPGGPVGVVAEKALHAAREANDAREKAEYAQKTAGEAGGSGLGLPVELKEPMLNTPYTLSMTQDTIAYVTIPLSANRTANVLINGGDIGFVALETQVGAFLVTVGVPAGKTLEVTSAITEGIVVHYQVL
jgi:hypothetical protein